MDPNQQSYWIRIQFGSGFTTLVQIVLNKILYRQNQDLAPTNGSGSARLLHIHILLSYLDARMEMTSVAGGRIRWIAVGGLFASSLVYIHKNCGSKSLNWKVLDTDGTLHWIPVFCDNHFVFCWQTKTFLVY